jgi:hypothetical protein
MPTNCKDEVGSSGHVLFCHPERGGSARRCDSTASWCSNAEHNCALLPHRSIGRRENSNVWLRSLIGLLDDSCGTALLVDSARPSTVNKVHIRRCHGDSALTIPLHSINVPRVISKMSEACEQMKQALSGSRSANVEGMRRHRGTRLLA